MTAALDPEGTVPRRLLPDPLGGALMAKFFRALGDPTRLGLVAFCATQERSGTDCVTRAGLSQGRVSAHLGCLVSCGLLTLRRQGRFAYYRVTDPRVLELLQLSQEVAVDHATAIAACTRVGPAR